MSMSTPLRRSSSTPGYRPMTSMNSTSSAGSVSPHGPDDDGSSRSRSSSNASEFSVGGSPISPPSGRPMMTLVRPSYQEACKARDASRERFASHDSGSPLSESTVRSDTNHLGQTVATVRNYLNATIEASNTDIDALDRTFQSAALHGSDIAAPLQELETLLNKTDQMIATMKADNPADPSIDNASELIREAKSQLVEAQDPHTDTSQRCHTALNVLRSLDEGRTVVFNLMEDHMKEAETEHRQMKTGIVALKDAAPFQIQGDSVLRCLDHVLQNGDSSPTEGFDMDAFIQLLYSKKELGNTLSTAANYHYNASGEDIHQFVGEIGHVDLQNIADQVANDMFGVDTHPTQIDIGAYLKEILKQAGTATPPIPNAAELLKEALQYIRPER